MADQNGPNALSAEFAERRAVERVNDEMDAVCVMGNGTEIACRVVDFSMMGACVEFDQVLPVGDELAISVPKVGLSYIGEVRWRKENRVGLLFQSAKKLDAE